MNKRTALEFVHVELKKDTWGDPGFKVASVHEAYDAIKHLIKCRDREMVIQLNLAMNGRVINASVVSIGNVNSSIMDPAGIIRTALLSGAPRIIVFHNHPSGCALPSDVDQKAAKRLAGAVNLMGLTLDDFVIIGDEDVYSMSDYDRESLDPVMMAAE